MFERIKQQIPQPLKQIASSAASYTVSAIYFAGKKIEKALLGDSRFINTNEFEYKLTTGQPQSLGIFGNIQRVSPPSEKVLAETLNAIDKQPDCRSPYRMLSLLTDYSTFFTQETSKESIHHRKQLLQYLSKPHEYAKSARETLKKAHNANEIIIRLMAKNIFNAEELPKDFVTQVSDLIDIFEYSVPLSAFPVPVRLFPQFRHAQKKFQQFSAEFLEMHIESIKHSIQTDARNNLIADVIIELMEKDGSIKKRETITSEEIRAYFKNSAVTSLFWIFVASSNIAKALQIRLGQLNFRDILQSVLKEHVISIFLADNKSPHPYSYHPSTLHTIIKEARETLSKHPLHDQMFLQLNQWEFFSIENLKTHLIHYSKQLQTYSSPVQDLFNTQDELQTQLLHRHAYLDRLYQQDVKAAASTLTIARYTKSQVQMGDVTIPARTTVFFTLPSDQSSTTDSTNFAANQFRLFSAGSRKCPGFMIAEYMYKSVIAEKIKEQEDLIFDLREQLRELRNKPRSAPSRA